MMDDLYTRFKAYAMPNGGISMSYLVDSSFTLIEARYNADNISKIKSEMELAGCTEIDLLHISSWDSECCNYEELVRLLDEMQPLEIEIPAYEPSDENGKMCRKLIREFCNRPNLTELFEAGHKSLEDPSSLPDADFTDIIFSPMKNYQDDEDNSIIKIFRQGKFSLLNVSRSNRAEEVLELLRKTDLVSSVDILIIYGWEESKMCNFVSRQFIDEVNPNLITLAGKEPQLMIKKSNNNLDDRGIRYRKTEQGDILVKYGIMSRKENVNLENNDVVGNGEYKKLVVR